MTALTPAQVREHARALIADYGADPGWSRVRDYVYDEIGGLDDWTGNERRDVVSNVLHAIRTARITVDWDEEA